MFPIVLEPLVTTIFKDPIFEDLVDLVQVNTLFGNPLEKVVSRKEQPVLEPTVNFEGHIADNYSQGRNIPPEREHWDTSLSPRREQWYTHFDPKDFVFNDQSNPLENQEGPHIENQYSLSGNNKKQDPPLEPQSVWIIIGEKRMMKSTMIEKRQETTLKLPLDFLS